jgi:type IV pilus assembly protein PilE
MELNKTQRKLSTGFTLVELMVVVVIAAVLASIAVPSYRDYVVRSKIPHATANLASKRVQMEQFFQDNKTYASAPACTSDTTSSKYFTFDCEVAATATTFRLRATGTGTMAGFVYTVDQTNAKATTGVPAGWTANANCWAMSKSGTC